MNEQLAAYIRESLRNGFSKVQIAERLRQEGWLDEDIQKALRTAEWRGTRKRALVLAIMGLVAFVFLCAGLYFLVISPIYVAKPFVEKPVQNVVDESMLEYVLTELGAYKLHANPFSGDVPEIEILVLDARQTFTATIEENVVRVRRGTATSPDARITVNQEAVLFLSNAQDEEEMGRQATQLLREREQRGLKAELLAEKGDLLLKGYLALYDEHKENIKAAGIIGGAVVELPLHASSVAGFIVIIIVLWGALVTRMALNRRQR